MSFPRYPEYKDSGVEWLGAVPGHWHVDRFKASVQSCRNGIWGNEALGDETDIPCVRVADFDRISLTIRDVPPTVRCVTERERQGRVLDRGNLLLEKSGGGEGQPVGCVVLYDLDEPAVCSNFVARMQLIDGMEPAYWRYVHAAAYNIRLTVGSINQTSGIQNLDQGRYFDERAPFPPSVEQITIAAFLDRETAKIDALVAEQETLIALLKEKRQAVVSHAVTKGLNPDAPMKPSGIEWLGDVPAHWEVRRIKQIAMSIEQGWSPQCEGFPAEGDEWAVLKVGCVNGGRFERNKNKVLPADLEPVPALALKSQDLLISRANTRELVGGAAYVPSDEPRLLLCDKLYRLRFAPESVVSEFVAHWLATPGARGQIELAATGASSSMVNIGQSTILELPIAYPPHKEQLAVVQSIGKDSARLDELTSTAVVAISLLKERRSALISAAVTGQIDVRGLAHVEAA